MAIDIPQSAAAKAYAQSLVTEVELAGAAYVLTGAHLMGGEIMRRRLTGYPTTHLEWVDRQEALNELKPLRQRPDIAQSARDCFAALLAVMDEMIGC
jgi:heme oxygenase